MLVAAGGGGGGAGRLICPGCTAVAWPSMSTWRSVPKPGSRPAEKHQYRKE